MRNIDGSSGEGGGQILRTSLALSLVTGKPFRIHRIRAGREKPGLMRQHLACVKAAAEIGSAEVTGASVGSTDVTFVPGEVRPGTYRFATGTAGSATLVLQTVLPPLLLAGRPSVLVLEGGTHNMHAPPFDFLAKTFLPLINRMGPAVTATLERPGFYPAGGGRLHVTIEPAGALSRLDLVERGPIERQSARAVVAHLPRHIAERELQTIRRVLGWKEDMLSVEEDPRSVGPGNVLMLEIESEHVTEVISGFGQRGVRAEDVGRGAAEEARRYLDADVPVGEHLADQLPLPLALAGGGAYKIGPLTPHTQTNIEVIRTFLDVVIEVVERNERQRLIRVG